MSGASKDLSTAAVIVCVQSYYLFTDFAKRRMGIGREFYRLIVPWGAATIGVMALFAWLVSRQSLPKPFIFVPAILTAILSLVEWMRWRSAKRSGDVAPNGRRV